MITAGQQPDYRKAWGMWLSQRPGAVVYRRDRASESRENRSLNSRRKSPLEQSHLAWRGKRYVADWGHDEKRLSRLYQ